MENETVEPKRKLWLLSAREPWKPWYDTAESFVVRADAPWRARMLASEEHGDEGAKVWLDPALTSCEELTAQDHEPEMVILRDFNAG